MYIVRWRQKVDTKVTIKAGRVAKADWWTAPASACQCKLSRSSLASSAGGNVHRHRHRAGVLIEIAARPRLSTFFARAETRARNYIGAGANFARKPRRAFACVFHATRRPVAKLTSTMPGLFLSPFRGHGLRSSWIWCAIFESSSRAAPCRIFRISRPFWRICRDFEWLFGACRTSRQRVCIDWDRRFRNRRYEFRVYNRLKPVFVVPVWCELWRRDRFLGFWAPLRRPKPVFFC